MNIYAVIVVTDNKTGETYFLYASSNREILAYLRICQKNQQKYKVLYFDNADTAYEYLQEHIKK